MLKYITVLPAIAIEKIQREINLSSDSPLEATLTELADPVRLNEGFKLVEIIFLLPKKILRRSASKQYTYKYQIQRKFTNIFSFKEDGMLGIMWGSRSEGCVVNPIVMEEHVVEEVADHIHWLIREDEIVFIDDNYFNWLVNESFDYGSTKDVSEAINSITENREPALSNSRCFKQLNLQSFIKDLMALQKRNPDSKASTVLAFLNGLLLQILEINGKRNDVNETIKRMKSLIKDQS